MINPTRTIQGHVIQITTFHKKDGSPYVKGMVRIPEQRRDIVVLWWDADKAPPQGAEVRIVGQLKTYKGESQIHANRTDRLDHELARLAGFYRDCLEAEIALAMELRRPGDDHVVLESGPNPLMDTVTVPDGPLFRRWLNQREHETEETLMAGWPLVSGADPQELWRNRQMPLLITEVRLDSRQCTPVNGIVDLNRSALELLGIQHTEIDGYLQAIAASPGVQEADSPEECLQAMLSILVDATPFLRQWVDYRAARSLDATQHGSIKNTAALFAATGTSRVYQALIQDLQDLANRPQLMEKGPAAVLLGKVPVPPVPPPKPQPVIMHSSLRQDEALHSAMSNVFTVVTGPPGTGKSQVLVNVVAAAVAQGQTVLVASTNNKAVDVVVDRLMESENAVIVRTGNAAKRREAAAYIREKVNLWNQYQSLHGQVPYVAKRAAKRAWDGTARKVDEILQTVSRQRTLGHKLAELNQELAELGQRLGDLEQQLPLRIKPAAREGTALETALREADTVLDSFGKHLGVWWRRRKHHRQRWDDAQTVLNQLDNLLNLPQDFLDAWQQSVPRQPTRIRKPREHFQSIHKYLRPIQKLTHPLQKVQKCSDDIAHAARCLENLPPKHELDDRLQALACERIDTSKALLETRWQELRHHNHATARKYANTLADVVDRKARSSQATQLVPKTLQVLPVWTVTNLSVRSNLPLQEELFDLVIIDEASQCSIASALPLLVRGKRALIIGDSQQLSHIVSLQSNREKRIAQQGGLSGDQQQKFSYCHHSCFDLASSRLQTDPIFLDLHFRSHPGIIGFADSCFYDGKLEWCSHQRPPNGKRAIEWVDVEGRSQRGYNGQSWINEIEAQTVVDCIRRELSDYQNKDEDITLGVVTPFNAQVNRISKLLEQKLTRSQAQIVLCATAHGFQGDERDIMYFSPVVDHEMREQTVEFAANLNLINVALTRAARRLVIVGSKKACQVHELGGKNPLRDLVEYVNGLKTEKFVFDSPLELELFRALQKQGIEAHPGKRVDRYRLDLAIEWNGRCLDIECDGHPFHQNRLRDDMRDKYIRKAGWEVLRLTGREIKRDLDGCVHRIVERLTNVVSDLPGR